MVPPGRRSLHTVQQHEQLAHFDTQRLSSVATAQHSHRSMIEDRATTGHAGRSIRASSIHDRSLFGMKQLGGYFGAAILIFATTVDDTVWLVPYITSRSLTLKSKVSHALLFIATLQVLTLSCVLLASGIQHSLPILGYDEKINQEHILTCISAFICWIITGSFYLKAFLKQRKRQKNQNISLTIPIEERPLFSHIDINYSNLSDASTSNDNFPQHTDVINLATSISFSPFTVITLTAIGALDELSYFPSLLTGNIFTAWQLLIGSLLASVVILVVVTVLLSKCTFLLDFLDRIPLYVIVGIFATILTVQAFFL